jgi:hypothetical protein
VTTQTHDERAAYALAILLGRRELDRFAWPDWLSYGRLAPGRRERGVHIVASGFFGSGHGTRASLPPLPLGEIDGVPLLFGQPAVERAGDVLVVKADVLASAYFLLTRYEEWVRRDARDEHGRFPGRESLPYRAGFIDRPVVDEYADLLRTWAASVGVSLPGPRREFSVLLTHDVDHLGTGRGPLEPLRAVAGGLLGRRSWRAAIQDAAITSGFRADPLGNFDDVIAMDGRLVDRFGPKRCRAVYFFMAGGRTKYDRLYNIRSARARRILRQVARSGASIGLHASYDAGRRPERIAAEHRALEEAAGTEIRGNRHHYLAWREPEDGHWLADSGITWDSTLGYADVPGFRLGVCRPIPLFDPVGRRPLAVEEHPLVVMDCTLSKQDYMDCDEQAAFEHVRKLADATFRHQGELVVLWHNHLLAPTDPSYHRRLYPRVLEYLDGLLAGG